MSRRSCVGRLIEELNVAGGVPDSGICWAKRTGMTVPALVMSRLERGETPCCGSALLRESIKSTGVGLHSGNKVTMQLSPAPVDTGIVFRRTDLSPIRDIPARADQVDETDLSTSLGRGEFQVTTVEHLCLRSVGLELITPLLNRFTRSADHGRLSWAVCLFTSNCRCTRAARRQAIYSCHA